MSFDVGIALLEEDSAKVDADQFADIERLAAAVKSDYRHYRTFPPSTDLNRFCM